jgi:hypothetical protein
MFCVPLQACILHQALAYIWFDAILDLIDGGYSSGAERLSVAQDVVGSIPTSRPNFPSFPENTSV